jgi:hypothetical protein
VSSVQILMLKNKKGTVSLNIFKSGMAEITFKDMVA